MKIVFDRRRDRIPSTEYVIELPAHWTLEQAQRLVTTFRTGIIEPSKEHKPPVRRHFHCGEELVAAGVDTKARLVL